MKKHFLTTSLTLIFGISFLFSATAQLIKLEDGEWFEGEIVLENGELISGSINANSIIYESILVINEKTSGMYPASKVDKLSFFDVEEGRDRKFVYLNLPYQSNNLPHQGLFEVLVEFDDFALVSYETVGVRNSPMNIIPAVGNENTDQDNKSLVRERKETVYYLGKNGELKGLLQISKGIKFEDFSARRFLEKGLWKKITGAYYSEVKDYAKKNHLNLKDKSDMIKVMEYHKSLI